MTGWGSPAGSPEVLHSGHDGSGSGGRLRVTVVIAVSLLVGGLLGYGFERETAGNTTPSPALVLRAGSVVACSGRCLELPVFNDGSRTVTVTAVGFDHGRVPATTTPTAVHPGTWRSVRFDLPQDCTAARPHDYRTVQVRASVAGVLEQRSLRMPDSTRLVRRHYDRDCPSGPPVTQDDLRGIWVLEDAGSASDDQVGRLLMNFGADGRFSWEPSGPLFDPHRAVQGRYHLARGRLVVTVENVNLCRPSDAYVWRVTFAAANVLHLRDVRGTPRYCGARDGATWVARRIIDDERLPETRARVNGR